MVRVVYYIKLDYTIGVCIMLDIMSQHGMAHYQDATALAPCRFIVIGPTILEAIETNKKSKSKQESNTTNRHHLYLVVQEQAIQQNKHVESTT